jgi:hypothetical protein
VVPSATLVALTTLLALPSVPQGERVRVWTNREGPFEQHSRVKTYVRTAADAYLAVVRVDTDGRLVLLFPYSPDDDAFARGGRTYQVQGRDDGYTFAADDPPGIGYLMAVASPDPLRLEIFEEGGGWHLAALGAEHFEGDPYAELTELAAALADRYDLDIAQYDVEARYAYPRFACYSCHQQPLPGFDPYGASCPRVRVVLATAPVTYPVGVSGRNGVAMPGARPAPRFVFEDVAGSALPVQHVAWQEPAKKPKGQAKPKATPPARAQPSRQPPAERPRAQPAQRQPDKPRAQPSAPARGTGEPELRRRRP